MTAMLVLLGKEERMRAREATKAKKAQRQGTGASHQVCLRSSESESYEQAED